MFNRQSSFMLAFLFLSSYNTTLSDETIQPNETTQPKKNFDEVIFDSSRTLAQVIDIANKKHYNIADPQESMLKAIDGFVSNLDAHSCILDEKTYKTMLEST